MFFEGASTCSTKLSPSLFREGAGARTPISVPTALAQAAAEGGNKRK